MYNIHPNYQTANFLHSLKNGLLPVSLLLAGHLVSSPQVHFSHDYFTIDHQIKTLQETDETPGFHTFLPLQPGQGLQYRFEGSIRHGKGSFYLNNQEKNFTFKLPKEWFYQYSESPMETLWQQLDKGLSVLCANQLSTEIPEGMVFFNLLGKTSFSDYLQRTQGFIHRGGLQFIVSQKNYGTYFTKVDNQWQTVSGTEYLIKRLEDKELQAIPAFKPLIIQEEDDYNQVLQYFEDTYFFPLTGACPWQHEKMPMPLYTLPLVAAFFESWIDVLLIDNHFIFRKQQ